MSDIPFALEDGKLRINPNLSYFFVLGMKTQENKEHWTEKFILDPHKKTMICFGGDQTRDARAANGYINQFIKTFGFSDVQQQNMQMLSHYYNWPVEFQRTFHRATNFKELIQDSYLREVLKVFMPVIATENKSTWTKLPDKDLLNNMRNIMFVTHCYGTGQMIKVINTLKQKMLSLGYEEKLIDRALKQILCITNNSQLEMTENIPTTTLQRYSVADGQSERKYNSKYSNSYPVHLDTHTEFKKIKGKKSAFIELKPNDVILAFDKILKSTTRQGSGTEHNDGFFTTDKKQLTKIGQDQMELTHLIIQYWYNNHDEMPNVIDLLKKVSKGTNLEMFVGTSILNGEILKKEHDNPMRNPHFLEVVKNRFENPDIEPEHTGIWKLLENSRKG